MHTHLSDSPLFGHVGSRSIGGECIWLFPSTDSGSSRTPFTYYKLLPCIGR